jgi:hypothetical protein
MNPDRLFIHPAWLIADPSSFAERAGASTRHDALL